MPGQGSARRPHAELIADIYDAAIDPAAWSGLASSLCRAVGGETSIAFISRSNAVGDFLLHNIAGEAVARYGAYYHSVDPLLAMSKRNVATRTESVFSYALLPEREFAETEFYRDFGREVATFHMLGCGLPIDAERTFAITVQRPVDGRRFEQVEKRRFDGLLPHLQRALQLRDRLAGDRLAGVGLAALDALAFGAVVCEADGRVRFANAAAEKLASAGTGISLRDAAGVLSAVRAKEGRALAHSSPMPPAAVLAAASRSPMKPATSSLPWSRRCRGVSAISRGSPWSRCGRRRRARPSAG